MREWKKWAVRKSSIAIVDTGAKSSWPTKARIVIINYDLAHKHREHIDSRLWDLVIADECHQLRNRTTIRTRNILGGSKTKTEEAIAPINASFWLFLTGTPILNRPADIFPIVRFVDPKRLGRSFTTFSNKYCDAKYTGWGWDYSGASNLDELQLRLRENCMVRRLMSEVLKEMPPLRRQVIELPAKGIKSAVQKEKQVYESHRAYLEELEAKLEAAENAKLCGFHKLYSDEEIKAIRRQVKIARSVAFSEMAKLRHRVALAKVPAVIEHLENALESEPVVFFCHHQDVAAQIAEYFGDRAGVVTGSTPLKERQQVVDDFQAGKLELFVGNIQAAGVGITLTRSALGIFGELDWVPSMLNQCERRLLRIGQTRPVLIQHLVLEDSLDAVMVEKLIAKQEVIDQALDSPVEIQPTGDYVEEVEIDAAVQKNRKQFEQQMGSKLTNEQVVTIHRCMRILAGMCDGAHERDDCGFNRFDSALGKALAGMDTLSRRQAAVALKMLPKYHRQLPQDLLAKAKGSK